MDKSLTPKQLSAYLVFRWRLSQYLQLFHLWNDLRHEKYFPENGWGHTGQQFAMTVRTAMLMWLVSMMDKDRRALNIIDLWCHLYPEQELDLRKAESQMSAGMALLRDFRNKVGAHVNLDFDEHIRIRRAVKESDEVVSAIKQFNALGAKMMKLDEETYPSLTPLIARFGF